MGWSKTNQEINDLLSFEFVNALSMLSAAGEDKEYFPEPGLVPRVFLETSYEDIRVVILGQDPYPTEGHAIGRAFAVNKDVSFPASLRIIQTELQRQYDTDNELDRTLQPWVDQGVFLLNTALTVAPGSAGSHLDHWRSFTQLVIKLIAKRQDVVFALWGKKAQEYLQFCSSGQIVTCAHPAADAYRPTARAFVGSGIFEKINSKLSTPIKWI